MVWLTLFFIVILTTVSKVKSLHCSDQQLPASGDDDLQQVTTLQYCLVDNCTIMMIDTGEESDTTDSLIVTTQTDGCTSAVITKLENEMSCLISSDDRYLSFIAAMLVGFLLVLVSGYTATIHIMFKKFRETLFGKLLMFYSLSVVSLNLALTALLVTHFALTASSYIVRHLIVFVVLLTTELLATCLLHHLTYLMYRSYKVRPEMSDETSKHFYKRYIAYVVGTILISGVLVIPYDLVTGNGRNTRLANGHCALEIFDVYDPALFMTGIAYINKIAQVVIFIIYLLYAYTRYTRISVVPN